MPAIELVVARHSECLNWLRNIPPSIHVTVYDKGPASTSHPGSIPLPNIGREAHSYLHHLLHRYNSAPDYTVFCQGRPFDHDPPFHRRLRSYSAPITPLSDFHSFGNFIDADDPYGRRLFVLWSKNTDGRQLDLNTMHNLLFGNDGPQLYHFIGGAQFLLSRKVWQSRSRQFYQHALDIAANFPDAAHCFERMWDRVFNVTAIPPEWLSLPMPQRLSFRDGQDIIREAGSPTCARAG